MAGNSSGLRYSPVLYHELSFLPIPFLKGHMLASADREPELVRRVLAACAIAPGQRRTGRIVEARLRAREMSRLAASGPYSDIAELSGTWLPGLQGADPLLIGFSEAGRYAAAAASASNGHHALKHLDGLDGKINALENQLRAERSVFTQPFEEPLAVLRRLSGNLRAKATIQAADIIPNPFRSGDPLSTEAGYELFRGREGSVEEVAAVLADPDHSASILLLAPRRCGKTSLLEMLPAYLPDSICVFFDIQAHDVSTNAALFRNLGKQAVIQAKRTRRVELPALSESPTLDDAAAWLDKLNSLPSGHRVLIAIDEFRRLEDLYDSSRRQEFLQFMGLLRSTIQHRRRVRLLVSGDAPFDELDAVWDDHFISARPVRLGFLDQPTSEGLLMQPEQGFPSDAIPREVAAEVYRRTGGQPFLLQVFGSLLVDRLNSQKRKTAAVEDVDAVVGKAFEWADSFFRDTHRHAPPEAREVLDAFARGAQPHIPPAGRRWLTRRCLLTADDRLAVPLFADWIGYHALV